ncbi:hypothetical protein SLEP1_g10692 [Rubroshorea leprosula]|uniref:Uncharacterized protein n=1 Tax=Rubroshorea leprosula TaxID=152421 RepID=A0AAV5IK89_9ROSI|nr:hypothetical protein SLEP1_g10692 [Rubroshorea leprosula]
MTVTATAGSMIPATGAWIILPLTTYQSYIHAHFLKSFDPDSFSLFNSHGYESYLGSSLFHVWFGPDQLTIAAVAATIQQNKLMPYVKHRFYLLECPS